MKLIAAGVMGIAAMAAMVSAAGAAEEYHSFILTMDSPPDGTFAGPRWMLAGGFTKGVADLEKTLVCGGKSFGYYPHVNFREGALTLDGKVLKGQFTTYDPWNRIGRWTMEGAVEGGKAEGTYTVKFLKPKTGDEKTHSGRFAGTVTPGSDLAKSNAIAAGKDWPCWSGPHNNMTSVPSGRALVDDLADARLVWRSQQALGLPQGNFSHPYYAHLFAQPTCGGGAAPIVGDGKVFATQWFPDGKEYQGDGLKKLQEALEKLGVKEPTAAMKLHVSRTCHDWYVCMDAATGQTLWVAEFPEDTGSYFESDMAAPDHKNGPVGNTPCYAGGKLFGLGLSGYLRAMDAKTGKLLWKQKIAGSKPNGRGNSNCPVVIGEVVMTGNHEGQLYACDAATGDVLWKATISAISDPQRWVHGGKEYAVVLASTYPKAEYRCFGPRTGKELWRFSGIVLAHILGICGDTIAVLESTGAAANPAVNAQGISIAAYRLTPEKAERIWAVPAGGPIEGRAAIVVTEKYVAAFGTAGAGKGWLLDLATGKELAGVAVPGPSNYGHVQVADDRFFVRPDGAHGWIGISMLGTTPETFKVMGKGIWSPAIPHTSSYAHKQHTMPIVDGRMYLRGADGIYCYDLREVFDAKVAAARRQEGASAAVAALVELLGDESEVVRRQAARSLGDIGHDARSAVPRLVALLTVKDSEKVQQAAALALARACPMVGDELAKAARHADPAARRRVVSAINAIGRPEATVTAILDEAVKDPDMAARESAVVLLVDSGPKSDRARRAVVSLLADAVAAKNVDLYGRTLAMVGRLGAQGWAAAAPAVLAALETGEMMLVLTTLPALPKLGPAAARKAIPQLRALLKGDKPEMWPRVSAAWRSLDPGAEPEIAESTIELLKSDHGMAVYTASAIDPTKLDDAMRKRLTEGLIRVMNVLKERAASAKGLSFHENAIQEVLAGVLLKMGPLGQEAMAALEQAAKEGSAVAKMVLSRLRPAPRPAP